MIHGKGEKTLILGAKGNLGSQLAGIFKGDYDVTAWDREEIDITDKELITNKIYGLKPDIIINAAAYNAVDKCEDDKEFALAKKLNGEAVDYLAEAAMAVGALLVHYSTDNVFAGNKKEGYKEGDKPGPVNKYGKSKLLGEQAVISRSGNWLKWYLIRLSKLFGPQGGSGAAKESFFDLMLRLSQERKEFNLVDGEEVSCPTYSPDLARATRNLVENNAPYGIYHITNAGACSWYEAAKYLFELKGVGGVKLNPVTSDEYPRSAKRPKYSALISTKLPPLRDWRDALREYLNF